MEPPCDPELMKSIAYGNKTHFDIAQIIHMMFRDVFVCKSIKHNVWYMKLDGSWTLDENAHSLRIKLSTDVVRMFCAVSAYHTHLACITNDEMERDRLSSISKRILALTNALKDHAFKNAVIKECCDLFFVRGFNPEDT